MSETDKGIIEWLVFIIPIKVLSKIHQIQDSMVAYIIEVSCIYKIV